MNSRNRHIGYSQAEADYISQVNLTYPKNAAVRNYHSAQGSVQQLASTAAVQLLLLLQTN